MKAPPWAWILILAAAAPSCGRPPRLDVVARLADEAIAYPRFEAYVAESVPALDTPIDGVVLSQLFDRFLEEELLARLASREQGTGERPAAIAELVAGRTAPVHEAEIARYHEAHRGELVVGARVDLRELLIDDREVADEAAARLARGEPFDRVAETLVPESAGVETWKAEGVTAAELPPSFAAVVFGLPAGGVSPVLEAEEGWVVFQVQRRLAGEQLPLAAAAPAIRQRLEAAHAAQARSALVAEARDRYDLQVFERNLPFAYSGRFRTPE